MTSLFASSPTLVSYRGKISVQMSPACSSGAFVVLQPTVLDTAVLGSWNNGKEVPRWGVAEIQKMSPPTTGRCSRHAAAVLSNKGVGTADQWERGMATRQPIT